MLPASARVLIRMAATDYDVDSCLERLLKFRQGQKTELKEEELKGICTTAKKILLDQPVLLELNAPIRIVGDVHGGTVPLSGGRLAPNGRSAPNGKL